jgi:hypothetical protein
MQYYPYNPALKYAAVLADPLSGTLALLGAGGLGSIGAAASGTAAAGAAAGGGTALTMGLQGLGTVISAGGSIVGGNYAKAAGQAQQAEDEYRAEQLQENAGSAIAAAQRRMMDTQLKTSLSISSARAGAAFGGVVASSGSPLTAQTNLAGRGAYEAGLDLWNGLNTATGLENQAQGERYAGELAAVGGSEAATGSDFAAAGSIVGGLANMTKTLFPPSRGSAYG